MYQIPFRQHRLLSLISSQPNGYLATHALFYKGFGNSIPCQISGFDRVFENNGNYTEGFRQIFESGGSPFLRFGYKVWEKTHLEAKGWLNIAKCVSCMVCAERSFYMDAYFLA